MESIELRWHQWLMVLSLLMCRMMVVFSFVPLFVGNGVPRMIRTIFVISICMTLLPWAMQNQDVVRIATQSPLLYLIKEALIGVVLGLIASVGFWGMQAAGVLVENQVGMSTAYTVDPLLAREEPMIGTLFMQLYTVLFLMSGGLLVLIGVLFESYQLWPLASMQPAAHTGGMVEALLLALGEMLLLSLRVAAPFIIVMLLVEVSLGWLSRFAPQLNVFFLSLPIKVLAMSLLLLLYGAMVSGDLGNTLSGGMSHGLEMLKGALHGRQ